MAKKKVISWRQRIITALQRDHVMSRAELTTVVVELRDILTEMNATLEGAFDHYDQAQTLKRNADAAEARTRRLIREAISPDSNNDGEGREVVELEGELPGQLRLFGEGGDPLADAPGDTEETLVQKFMQRERRAGIGPAFGTYNSA